MAENGATHLSFTGNCYIEHRVSVHQEKEGFRKLIELLKASDLSFANMECAIQDGEDWPAFGSGMGWAGTFMGAPPSMIEELRFMGIDAVYAANNHVADFAERGILTTINYLKRGRMPYAGIGASLTEAAQPTYLETENARVALIALADWGPRQMMDLPFPWPAGYMGSDELPPYKSRPGVNLLRYDAVVHVDRAAFEQLRRISQELNWKRGKVVRFQGAARTEPLVGSSLKGWEKDTDTEFFFMGRKFVLGEKFRMATFPFREDLDRTYKHVTEARRHADVVIVALHDQAHGIGVHDYINTYEVTKLPVSMKLRLGLSIDSTAGELLEDRERNRERAVNAGGQTHAFSRIGSAVHTVVFAENAALKEVRIHPTEEYIIHGRRPRLSVPRLAEPEGEKFNQVIERARERSKPFGTRIEIRDGMGVARPG